MRRTKILKLKTFSTRVYLAIGVSILFALLAMPGVLNADYLKFFSNICLSFGAAVVAYEEWAKTNKVAVSNTVKSFLIVSSVILVTLCIYLLIARYV